MTERIGGCSYMKRYGHLYEKIYDMQRKGKDGMQKYK